MLGLATSIARFKSWQVFLVTGLPFVFLQFLFMPDPEVMRDIERFEALFSRMMWSALPIIGLVYVWVWSIGRVANGAASSDIRRATRFFDVCLPYAFAYIVFAIFFFPKPSNFADPPVPMTVIFPLHMLAMICILYAFAFSAKSIRTAEQGRRVGFWSSFFPFLLIWFFPIGVWFIQPRMNSISTQVENGS